MAFIWVRVPQHRCRPATPTRSFSTAAIEKVTDAATVLGFTYDAPTRQQSITSSQDAAALSPIAPPTTTLPRLRRAEMNAGFADRRWREDSPAARSSTSLRLHHATRLIPAKGGTLSAWVRIDQPQTNAQADWALEDQRARSGRWLIGIRGAHGLLRCDWRDCGPRKLKCWAHGRTRD